jgi:hypothetical protein
VRWWGWEVQRHLRCVSSLSRVRQCGRSVISEDGLVRVAVVGGGAATRVFGVMSCGSPWVCPVCHRRWAQRRAAELSHAFGLHVGGSGGLELLTVGVPHAQLDPLAVVWARCAESWAGLLEQRWWKQAKRDLGVFGMVRAVEVSRADAGPHVHVHAVLLTRERWDAPVRAAIFKRIGEWFRRGRGAGPEPEIEGVGQLPPPGTDLAEVREPDAVAKYLTAGASKGSTGRADVGRSMFGMLAEHARTGDPGLLARWHEFERASKGKHPLHWSASLRGLFSVDGRSDREPLPAEHTVVRTLTRREYLALVAEDRVGELRKNARSLCTP